MLAMITRPKKKTKEKEGTFMVRTNQEEFICRATEIGIKTRTKRNNGEGAGGYRIPHA